MMHPQAATPVVRADGPTLRLFCLPYAGGSAQVFRAWSGSLPSWVQVCPLEPPGRGTRFKDRPLDRVEAVVGDLTRYLLPQLDGPFAIAGYSYGALVGYELARRLESEHGYRAEQLFVAAMRGPAWPSAEFPVSRLPDLEFRRYLRTLGGTPAELLENDALMEVMRPVLRADFRAVETYCYRPSPPLGCPVTAIGGEDDRGVSRAALRSWRVCTTAPFRMFLVPGGHFFLHSARAELLAALTAALEGRS
jgi:medium-chain acyl-[acyl-carrier-protein] hydrolase